MHEAIALAVEKMRQGCGGPFGALVVKDGRVIGRGWNRVTSTNDPTAHAEVVAIRDACAALGAFHLDGAVLYANCEPCPMCLAAAYWARVSGLYYACTRADAAAIGFADEHLYEELAKDVAQRDLPMRQILREDGSAAFEEWLAKDDRIEY